MTTQSATNRQTLTQQDFERRKAEERTLTERYKSDINLVTFLVDQGWEPIRGKHTRNWAALEDPSSGRKVMVHRVRETGHYAYTSFQDNKDKGTIINFIADQLKLDLGTRDGWKSLHAHLSPMVGNVYNSHETIRPVGMKDIHQLDETATAKLLNIEPLQNRKWLYSRHLDDKVIDAPEFTGQIVQRPFETKGGFVGVNTAFPMRNMDHIVTLNTRGTGHNMLVSPKQDSVWLSNIVPGVKPREIVITENPVDALSHFKLNPPQQAGERLYVSTGGQPGGLQLPTLQKIIDKIKPERFVLANDNDFSGIRFNIQYMGQLKLPQQAPQTWQAYLTEGNQRTGNPNQLRLTLPRGIEPSPGKTPEELVNRITTVMNQGHLVEETKARVTLGKSYLGDTEITVDIPNNRPMLIRAENLTKEIRQTDTHFVVKRSVEKDFNDDLKVLAQRQEQEIEKIRASRPENRRDEPITLQPEWLVKLQRQLREDQSALIDQKGHLKVGPTGLPLHQYEKGALTNELPDDGAKRIRKETSQLTAEPQKQAEPSVAPNPKQSRDSSSPTNRPNQVQPPSNSPKSALSPPVELVKNTVPVKPNAARVRR